MAMTMRERIARAIAAGCRVFAPHKGVERQHEFDPIIIAAPMIWPWSAEQHAEGVEQFYRQEMVRRLRVWKIEQAQEAA